MANQYTDQYKKETARIHAPIDLIERTKAAIREEEERLSREREAQEKVTETICEDEEKRVKRYPVHRWVYPFTAAAALLVLISVSLTMRGIKGDGSEESGAAYEESADAGYAESAVLDIAAEESGATEAAMGEGAVSEAADEAMCAEPTAGAAAETDEALSVNEAQRSTENAEQETADSIAQEAKEAEAVKTKFDLKKEATAESLTDSAASMDGILIEKAEKKPDFCDLPDTETHVYEGITFLVRKEENDWMAYVETEDKTGYVLCGETESLEAFLKVGREKLIEMRGED